ncbi:Phytochrome-like protein cph2 [compost metagenome]
MHKLKLDMSFVRGLPHDSDDVAITRAVVALGHSLELKVLAEGIERPEQMEFLRQIGCDYGQGYLFGRPQPAKPEPEPTTAVAAS